MILSSPKLLLIYPPLDRSILPPLATATLVASVKKQLGSHAAEGLDLNFSFQRELLNESKFCGLECSDQTRYETLDAFCQINGLEASEEKLLISDWDHATSTSPLDDLFSTFMGEYLSNSIKRCLDAAYSLVGISVCYPSQLVPALLLANVIRNSKRTQHIALGGPYVSLHAERLLEIGWLKNIDCIVRGPGETILPEIIVTAATSMQPHRTVIFEGSISPLQDRITPDFCDLEPTNRGWPKPVLPYLSSIGCSWGRCTFCRGLKPEPFIPSHLCRVATDLSFFNKFYNVGGICFSDEALDLSVVASAFMASNKDNQIGWVAEARLDKKNRTIDPVFLAASGCRYLLFGLESGSQRVLNAMRKGVTIRTAEEIICRYAQAGILIHLFLMVGFPGETEKDVNHTLLFLERNERWIASASVSCFRPWPGTAIWQQPNLYGLIFDFSSLRDELENQPNFRLKNGPKQQIIRDRRAKILDHPVMQTIQAKLPISHRACASMGNECCFLARLNGRNSKIHNEDHR